MFLKKRLEQFISCPLFLYKKRGVGLHFPHLSFWSSFSLPRSFLCWSFWLSVVCWWSCEGTYLFFLFLLLSSIRQSWKFGRRSQPSVFGIVPLLLLLSVSALLLLLLTFSITFDLRCWFCYFSFRSSVFNVGAFLFWLLVFSVPPCVASSWILQTFLTWNGQKEPLQHYIYLELWKLMGEEGSSVANEFQMREWRG